MCWGKPEIIPRMPGSMWQAAMSGKLLRVASRYVLVSQDRSSFQLSIKKVMKADLFVR